MPIDPVSVAGKLTEAQREAILRQPCRSWWGDDPAAMPHSVATGRALCRKGLADEPRNRASRTFPLTPLGLAVRRELEKEKP